ncbi:DUF3179 domain-containing protein [bacterium]|nr:DUF3179 domain-containing protein [bacterium]
MTSIQQPLSRRTIILVLIASACAIIGGLWLYLRFMNTSIVHREPIDFVPISGMNRWGFNLTPLLIPRAELMAIPAAPRKDDIPALSNPDVVAAPKGQSSYDPEEHVIGVAIGGQSRAWPLAFLNWHCIINDTLGGEPIAVTWHRLTGTAAVFSRRVGRETLEFGVSGLLYQANLIFFDRRRDPNAESLWSQVLMRAISGPAAANGRRLEPIDCDLLPLGEWIRMHPDTTIMSNPTGFSLDYAGDVMYIPPALGRLAENPSDEYVMGLKPAPSKLAEVTRRTDLSWNAPTVVLIGPKTTRAWPFADIKPAGTKGELDGIAFRLYPSAGLIPGIKLETTGTLKRVYMDWALWNAIE